MTEVHRYQVVTMLSMAGATIGYDPHGPEVVMASAYDQLKAKNEQLKADLTNPNFPPKHARRLIAQLRNESAALRKDAERYRWLRHHERTENDAELVMRQHGSMLDVSIDAAMGKGEQP